MSNMLLKLYVQFEGLRRREEGQDLVEYALLLCLISLALITAMNGISSSVNKVFNNISGSLA